MVDEVDMVVKETTAPKEETSKKERFQAPSVTKQTTVKDVTIKETISFEDRPLNPLKTLLSGAPNPRSLALSATSLLVNLLCVVMVADRLFRDQFLHTVDDLSFARVGYVSENEARLLIREPDQHKMPITVEVRIKDPQPPFDSPLWHNVGGVRWTTNETDYTAVIPIPLPRSKRRVFEWRTSNNHSGTFTTPPPVGKADDTNYGPFTFVTTSCIVPRLPYSPFDHPLAIPGFRHLAKVLPTLGAQFMLFLGDFIYSDVPRYWGRDVGYYRQKYRQVYASPDWPAVGQNLSWIHVLDDHEIANDWSANSTGVYATAVDPFHNYHSAANPPPANMKAGRPTYFTFTQGPATFFLLDTRSFRSANHLLPADHPDKTMLGKEQLQALLAWLRRSEPKGVKWKIVASSVPFTKNWHVDSLDTWAGFLHERQTILKTMWEVGRTQGVGVVVLSGDRHEFAATKFPPPFSDETHPVEGVKDPDEAKKSSHESAAVWEFSVSPLSQFYSPVPSYWQSDAEDVMIK